MTIHDTNPFLDPRAADSLNGKEYVRCFSPYLVSHLPEVFAQGNVILRGSIGCGKSMILRLFDPKVRIAYHDAEHEFPVPSNYRHFIGTGINLSKSGVLDIIQRLPSSASEEDIHRLSAIFADYLNYWLVDDLLESCSLMMNHRPCFGDLVDPTKLNKFVMLLVQQDCWVGYLDSCKSLEDIKQRIDSRLNHLRSWANWNVDLDQEIERSKAAIGEPVARSADCMKRSGLLHSDAIVFVRIDQVEELLHKDPPQYRITEEFRRRIYLALGRRDGRVSYRIGTRTYDGDTFVMPGGRRLEESRDYVKTEFDTILRRSENVRNWAFKEFAHNVFERRLNAAFPHPLKQKGNKPLFQNFFGTSPFPQALIEHIIVKQDTPVEALFSLELLESPWRDYIRSVYRRETALSPKSTTGYKIDPLNAILALAWALQRGGRKKAQPRHITDDPPRFDQKAPWTEWWKKERINQAILQLAISHKQKLVWWGSQDVLALSSNNITLFLSICRETWELWQRDQKVVVERPSVIETVPPSVQRVAIDNISKRWHDNFKKQPGRPAGDVRIRFLDRVFADLQIKLLKDKAMQCPGGNGFSIREDEIGLIPELERLLKECAAWGDLEEIIHTSKNATDKIRGQRFKYYANSLLAPRYQIFEAHTKEPRYVNAAELLQHAKKSKAIPQSVRSPRTRREQPELNLGEVF